MKEYAGTGLAEGVGIGRISIWPDDTGELIAADSLLPASLTNCMRGLILRESAELSHVVVLARSMGIPIVGGLPPIPEWSGRTAIVNGETGMLTLEPTDERLAQARAELEKNRTATEPTDFAVLASAASLADVDTAVRDGVHGVGLFRTEPLFWSEEPDETTQFFLYRAALHKLPRVVFRTVDFGGDKQPSYLPSEGERGLRASLARPELLRAQLRALWRAAADGDASVLYPMVASAEELRRVQTLTREIEQELQSSYVPFRRPRQGAMLETPAAVITTDLLAPYVDFFCVGTNDLAQFTLGIPRERLKLREIAQEPALCRMIALAIENAKKADKPVTLCGELARNRERVMEWRALGADGVIVPPSAIRGVCAALAQSVGSRVSTS